MSIVVAYEATPEADAALDAGIAEAELRGLPLHLVTYVGGAVVEGPGEAQVARTQHDAADEALDVAVSRATAGGVSATSHVVGGLDPAGAIVELARQVDAQLVVTGMRRRSAVGKLLMGSTSRDLIMAADCPVLAVKAAG